MKARILIVEDEAILAMSFKQYLTSFGFDVVGIASTGEDAIKQTSESEADLVLMDIILKGDMDGIEAATLILEDYDIPVVYLTAHPEENIMNRAKKTFPYGYITKPISKTDLKNTVDLALYKHSMERKLKESEIKYRTLFDANPNYIILIGVDGKVQDVNDSVTYTMGKSKKDLIGKHFLELEFIDEDKSFYEEQFDRIIKDQDIKPFEYQFTDLNDLKHWIYVYSTPITLKKDISSVLVIASDITKIKYAEMELIKRRNELDNAQKIGRIGSFHYDFIENIEIWSPNLYRILKIDQGTPMGFDRLFDYIIPEDHSIFLNSRKELFQELKPVSLELRMIDTENKVINVFINIDLILGKNNHPLELIGTVQDITDRIKSQDHLKKLLK